MGKANFGFIDHDSEGSNVGVRIVDLTAGNIAAQLTAIGLLQTALENVTLGNVTKVDVLAQTTVVGGVAPANGQAQRETKWLVSGVDSAGFPTTLEIPTADLSLLPAGSGVLDISAGAGLALKNALEAVWQSRQGNAVTVSRVIHVGRNI